MRDTLAPSRRADNDCTQQVYSTGPEAVTPSTLPEEVSVQSLSDTLSALSPWTVRAQTPFDVSTDSLASSTGTGFEQGSAGSSDQVRVQGGLQTKRAAAQHNFLGAYTQGASAVGPGFVSVPVPVQQPQQLPPYQAVAADATAVPVASFERAASLPSSGGAGSNRPSLDSPSFSSAVASATLAQYVAASQSYQPPATTSAAPGTRSPLDQSHPVAPAPALQQSAAVALASGVPTVLVNAPPGPGTSVQQLYTVQAMGTPSTPPPNTLVATPALVAVPTQAAVGPGTVAAVPAAQVIAAPVAAPAAAVGSTVQLPQPAGTVSVVAVPPAAPQQVVATTAAALAAAVPAAMQPQQQRSAAFGSPLPANAGIPQATATQPAGVVPPPLPFLSVGSPASAAAFTQVPAVVQPASGIAGTAAQLSGSPPSVITPLKPGSSTASLPGTTGVLTPAAASMQQLHGSLGSGNFASAVADTGVAPLPSQVLSAGGSMLSAQSGLSSSSSAPRSGASLTASKAALAPVSAAHAAEATRAATAVAAQQTATAQQAAATFNVATSEAAAAQQAATILTATAQQAVIDRRPDVAQEAAQQAVQAEQQAAALTAVAQEAAAVYSDASKKANEAQLQASAARVEALAVAAATQAVQAAVTTLAGSGGAAPAIPTTLASTASGPSPAMAPPALVPQHSSATTATLSSADFPSRTSTLISEGSAQSMGQLPLSMEQAQQQLALLQQYLAQQAQQAQQAPNSGGVAAQSAGTAAHFPQAASLSAPGSVPLPPPPQMVASHVVALPAVTVGSGGLVAAAPAAVPVAVPAAAVQAAVLPGMPASAPLAAQIAAGVLVPSEPPSQPALSPPAASVATASQATQSTASQPVSRSGPRLIKVVCSSGGNFMKLSTGAWEYEGGETRLLGIPYGASLQVLLEALERITAPSSESSEARPFVPQLKYRLPSDPSVWVDLVDDDDVQMMFDEWAEYCQEQRSSAKLHVFIQWRGVTGDGSSLTDSQGGTPRAAGEPARACRPGNTGDPAVDRAQQQTEEDSSDPSSGSEDGGSPEGDAAKQQRRRRGGRQKGQVSRLRPSIDLAAIVEKMEIIDVADITLVRFLGSGGYGDVYLAKWHNCEVAVKSLNPSMFFSGGDLCTVNKAAIIDLVKEADMLGSLRHPNIVWVYGIVLPNLEERKGWKRGKDLAEMIAGGGAGSPVGPGLLRPPALVAEYMGGGSLKSALGRRADIVAGALTRVVLALDAAKGMEYLHSKHIVHFDLKSGNLLLGYRDRRPVCKVADFGLSKQKFDTFVSGVTSQRGTLPWTAPEIIRTPDKVDEKADVFSFGIVMWELWTGREPYDGLNYHALLLQLSSREAKLRPPIPGSPEWEGDALPELAPGWQALMERCWAEDSEDRPGFSAIIRDLRGMVSAIKPPRSEAKAAAAAGKRST